MKLKEINSVMAIKCNTKQEVELMISERQLPHVFMSKWEALNGDICFRRYESGEWCYEKTIYYENSPSFEVTPFSSLIIEEKTYEDGLNEAWAAAKKIVLRKEHGGLPCEDLQKIFEREPEWEVEYSVFKNLTPQEVIAKLEAHEEEKQIKVGDVVEYFTPVSKPHVGIYLSETRDERWILSPHCKAPQSLKKRTGWQFRKTGKNIDISSILAEIRKE